MGEIFGIRFLMKYSTQVLWTSSIKQGVITALNTQINQAYLRLGAIIKLQFQ